MQAATIADLRKPRRFLSSHIDMTLMSNEKREFLMDVKRRSEIESRGNVVPLARLLEREPFSTARCAARAFFVQMMTSIIMRRRNRALTIIVGVSI
jgi:hypothetical protein